VIRDDGSPRKRCRPSRAAGALEKLIRPKQSALENGAASSFQKSWLKALESLGIGAGDKFILRKTKAGVVLKKIGV
jgi:hypothetical protein